MWMPLANPRANRRRTGSCVAGLAIAGSLAIATSAIAVPSEPAVNTKATNDGRAEASGKLAQVPPNLNQARPTLRPGSEGAAIVELQGVLRLMGYYAGAVSGRYDDRTIAAVTQFQQAAGLPADGIVGINTWNSLFPPMQVGGIATPLYNTNAAANPNCNCPPTATSGVPAPNPDAAVPATAPAPAMSATAPAASDLPVLSEGDEGSAVVELQLMLQERGFYQGAIDGMFGSRTATAVESLQAQYGLSRDRIVGPATWGVLLGY